MGLETGVFFVQRNHPASVVDNGVEFFAIEGDAGVLHQLLDILFVHLSNGVRIELSQSFRGARLLVFKDIPDWNTALLIIPR